MGRMRLTNLSLNEKREEIVLGSFAKQSDNLYENPSKFETEDESRLRLVLCVFAYALGRTDEGDILRTAPTNEAEIDAITDAQAPILEELREKKIYVMNDSISRWLFKWFGFEADRVVTQPASKRIMDEPLPDFYNVESAAEAAHNKRVLWAKTLLDTLLPIEAFNAFEKNAAKKLMDKFEQARLKNTSTKFPVVSLFKLSSSVPGVLSVAWKTSSVNMPAARFYLEKDDLTGDVVFWVSLDKDPTPFTLDDVLTYNPFKKSTETPFKTTVETTVETPVETPAESDDWSPAEPPAESPAESDDWSPEDLMRMLGYK